MFDLLRRGILPLLFAVCTFTVSANTAFANVRLSGLFSDGMVVQQQKPIRVWGKADPGELIGVKLKDQGAVATADKQGNWGVTLQPLPASNSPADMIVHGKNEIVIHDVLVGEVWLCAGQSNMGLPYSMVNHLGQDTEDISKSTIRLLRMNHDLSQLVPKTEPNLHWAPAQGESLEKFSGIAALFGLDLSKDLNVPIGLIQSAHGGASLETLVSRASIDPSNEFHSIGSNSDKTFASYDEATKQYKTDMSEWVSSGKQGKAPEEPKSPESKRASSAFDALVAPVVPFSMRGIIFYQGEADVYTSPLRYRRLFALLVHDWRSQLRDSTLPIIYVQLPNFGKKQSAPEESSWALMRETQTLCRRIPYAYMVVTIDQNPGAIADMHPIYKRQIARRLATVALVTQYHMSKPYTSPIYDSMTIVDGKIRVKFRDSEKGLITPFLPVLGFEIAGENKRWFSAKAQVDGDSVVVWSSLVRSPIAVRYAWADNPNANLFSADKLPVAPFRTDDWDKSNPKASAI